MKVFMFIYSLGSGGAERVCVNMANNWANKGHDVTILTFTRKEQDFYALESIIKRETLSVSDNLTSGWWAIITRNFEWIKKIRAYLKEYHPNVIINFMTSTNVLAILATKGMKIPVIVTEHTNPKIYNLGVQWRVLRRVTYPFASVLVSVSKGTSDCFSWLPSSRRTVITNMLAPEFENLSVPSNSATSNQIIAMGRLVSEKGFDLLLTAFAEIADRHPDWNLLILGEGEERQKLQKEVDDLDLKNRVAMPGVVIDPVPFLQKSSIFVLSSRFEGFANVIVEAMACGLPVISFDCDYGPSEIITHGKDGILVPAGDVDALARAMENLIQDRPQRNRLVQNAQHRSKAFYIDNIMKKWETLVRDKSRPSPLLFPLLITSLIALSTA